MKRSPEYDWDAIEEEDKTSSFKRRPDYEYNGIIYPDEQPDWELIHLTWSEEVVMKYWYKGDFIDARAGVDASVNFIEGALFIDDERIEL